MAGIYIHIPFCKSRCKYCDFFSTTHLQKQAQYVEAVLAEWQMRQHQLSEPIHTIYIGGGTPSTLDTAALVRILHAILSTCTDHRPHEITIEANPGDITLEKAQAWRAMGINRLSMGIQSFHDHLLQLIGRRHNAKQAIEAVQLAQAAGFDNISFDLMYARADEIGGMVSGEHGIGFAKRSYLVNQLGAEQVRIMRGIKAAFDPKCILNPDKVIPLED